MVSRPHLSLDLYVLSPLNLRRICHVEDLSSIVVLAIMFRYVKGCGTENERALDGKETRLKIPFSLVQGISDRKDVVIFLIRSLTPQQATGNALAVAVHFRLQCP